MPRKIDPRFGADEPVELDPDEAPSSEALAGVIDLLAGEFDRQQAANELVEIAEDHLRWRKQAKSDVSGRECNEQFRRLIAASQPFADDPEGHASEIKTMIAGLSGQACLALWKTPTLQRPKHAEPWTLPEMMENPAAVLAAAHEASHQGSGPKRNMSLAITVDRLATFYERATGEAATHSPNSKGQYKGPPQSAAGQFITAFFRVVDEIIHATQLSTPLALVLRSRRMRAAGAEGANNLIGDT